MGRYTYGDSELAGDRLELGSTEGLRSRVVPQVRLLDPDPPYPAFVLDRFGGRESGRERLFRVTHPSAVE